VKTLVFTLATYGCETWTIKEAERKKIVTPHLLRDVVLQAYAEDPLDSKGVGLDLTAQGFDIALNISQTKILSVASNNAE